MASNSTKRYFKNCSRNIFAGLLICIGVVATSLSPKNASAAVITWQSAKDIAGSSDVATQGTLVRALNPGGSSTTINGVTFAAFANTGSGTTVSSGSGTGDITMVASGSSWSSGAIFGANPAAAPYSSLPTAYQTLLGSATFTLNATSAVYTIGGLTLGQSYLIELWVNDSRNIASVWTRNNTFSAGNSSGALDFNVQNANGGVGQYTVGTFTADAVTENISVSSNASVQLSGYQLRAIPEPSVIGTFALAILVGLWLRRRTQMVI